MDLIRDMVYIVDETEEEMCVKYNILKDKFSQQFVQVDDVVIIN